MNCITTYEPAKAFTSSLELISSNYACRCDSKFADPSTLSKLHDIEKKGAFILSEVLPIPFIKGLQPSYLDQPSDDSVPVINTLSIQNLSINAKDCRHISRDEFDTLSTPESVTSLTAAQQCTLH